MRSRKKLLNDFKIKKIKFGITNQNADTLFGLVLKYLIPLKPESLNFMVDDEKIEIRSKINDWDISLLLFYLESNSNSEAHLTMSTAKNEGISGFSGSRTRAKKALLNIQQIIKKDKI